MSNQNKVVTRFAPSPTGFMHVGGVRTALFAWLFARKNKGTFILRIEDTDKEREVQGSIPHIIESLKWIGINWDEGPDIGGPNGPYIQSERLDSYKRYAQILIDKGLAYADPYTSEEIESFKQKAEMEKKPFLYRNHRPENPPVWDGSKPLRLKITDIKTTRWHDLVRGHLEAGPEALDDFILIKSDGFPTYNFAHIIDDLEMGTTHIFRADEFISSTPKYLALYDALEIKRPELATLPPIMGPDGKKKLGKRDGAKDILDYKKEGYLPEAMLNFLAFIGWNPGGEKEIYSAEEIIEVFDVSKIQKAGGKFNEEKLIWYNREYIKIKSDEEFLSEIIKRIPDKFASNENLKKIVPIVRDRVSKWSDIDQMLADGDLEYFFEAPQISVENLICPEKLRKDADVSKEDISKHLGALIQKLEEVDNWQTDDIKNSIWDYATEQGRGVVLWAMRYALSGKEKSPDPFILGFVLGKKETLARLNNAKEL